MQPYAPSLWCSTCYVCASADYMQWLWSHIVILPRTSQYRMTFILFSMSPDHVFDGVGLAGFTSRSNVFILNHSLPALQCRPVCANFTSFILTHLFLPSLSVSLSYFILTVPMSECLGKYSCISSPFLIAIQPILNGPC